METSLQGNKEDRLERLTAGRSWDGRGLRSLNEEAKIDSIYINNQHPMLTAVKPFQISLGNDAIII